MPPKTGLLGTLSLLALGVGLTVGGGAVAQVQDQQRFVELCSWIDEQNDPQELQAIIIKLNNNILAPNAEECIFDPVNGREYCNVCLGLAAQKLIQITNTADEPPPTTPHPG